MQTAWAKFAQDPVGGLESYGWPRYNPFNATIAVLGDGSGPNPSGVTFEPSAMFDIGCGVVNALAPDVYQLLAFFGSSGL